VRLVGSGVPESCEPAHFLAPLKPWLSFAAAGPGFMLGAPNASTDAATGAVTWSQEAAAFLRQPPALAAQLLAAAGASPLGSTASLDVLA
jgi:hypothetical protein